MMERMKGERRMVDATLVSEMLRMSPEERLRQNDRAVATIKELRRAFAAKRADKSPNATRG